MRVNKRDLYDGALAYLYIGEFILNGSGDGTLHITGSLDWAIKNCPGKLYKVVLEEIEVEEYKETVPTEVTKYRVKQK